MDTDQQDEAFQPGRSDEALYDFSYDDDGYNGKSPDGQMDDESNMSALDLYTDMVVRDSEEAALSMAKLKEEKTSFKAQLDVALLQVSKLSKENEALTKENKVLKSNISVLLKTAKTELQRKERELNELRDMQISGMRPAGSTLSPRSRKTRRGPKNCQPPPSLRQNGVRHPPNNRNSNTARAIIKKTEDSDIDDEQKPNVRETMFVRRQRAKNQLNSAGKMLQTSKVPLMSSDESRLEGGKKPITDALVRLSQMPSHNEDKLQSPDTNIKDGEESGIQGQKGTKDSETQKAKYLSSAVQSLETQRKPKERLLETVKEQPRSKSKDRVTRSRSGERSSTKRSTDSSQHDQKKHYPSPSQKPSSRGHLGDKNLSPSRSSRSTSKDKRSSRSKSSDRMLSPRTSSRSKSQEKRRSRSKSRERRSLRSKSKERQSSRSKSKERSKSCERRSSRSKSCDRALHQRHRDTPQDIKTNTEETSLRGSPATSLDSKRSRSERDRLVRQAESPGYSRSRDDRRTRTEKYRSQDRHRDRDRRGNRRSSTPVRDPARKDSKISREDQTKQSSVQIPSNHERDRRRFERSQSRARERMSSIAKESVAKAKATLIKRTSGYSSPKKRHRSEKDRRRSSLPSLDGLTDWTKAESSYRDQCPREIKTDSKEDQSSRRKRDRKPEDNERKRKHSLSSSSQKQSQQLAKKRRAGSESERSGSEDVVGDDSLGASGTNPATYEEGHTVLACGIRDSIECTSSKVTVLHTSVSDAYDTTQSDMSFLCSSGLQGNNGAPKSSADVAGTMDNVEFKEDGELSEGEIISDDEKGTKKAKRRTSEKKKRRSSKHKHRDHRSKGKEDKNKTPKSAKRGKKHKRRSSTDLESRERKKRLKENKRSDDSIQSQTEDVPSACKDDLVGEPVSPTESKTVSNLDDLEIAQKISDDNLDKENCPLDDLLLANKTEAITMTSLSEPARQPSGDVQDENSETEAIVMTPVSEPTMQNNGDVRDKNSHQTKARSSPEEVVEDGMVSTVHGESENERIIEDNIESDIVAANLGTKPSPVKSISSPSKELNHADDAESGESGDGNIVKAGDAVESDLVDVKLGTEPSLVKSIPSPAEYSNHDDEPESGESGDENILESEAAVENDIADENLVTEPSPVKSIPPLLKESNHADELVIRQEANEADAYASRGVLFEDLCLSSSMDDTSFLSCAEPNTELQRHSFVNSIEKVDVVIKEIADPLVNPATLEIGKSQKPSEELENHMTENNKSLETAVAGPHPIHVIPETTTNLMRDPSKAQEIPCGPLMEEVIPDAIVADATPKERINTSHTDTSVELNTSKSSELAQDDDESDHILDENNDAVSLLAASGELHSFMLDNTIPKVRKDLDLSLDESKDVLEEQEVPDKSTSMLRLTCEWSNIEFQDSSTKMGAETEVGPVTLAAPVFDDGCAQDMDYAQAPVDINTSAIEKDDHELVNKTMTGDEEGAYHIAETLKGISKEKGERNTDQSNEALENATDSKSDKEAFGRVVKGVEKEMEQEQLDQERTVQKMEGDVEHHVSSKPIVISDEESALDFRENAEKGDEDEVDKVIEDDAEEEEESVYIVDVQYANADNRAAEQEGGSCVDSQEEEEESDVSGSDQESKTSPDETSAVGKSEGKTKITPRKSQSEYSEDEIELDWGSEPEDQSEIVGDNNIYEEKDDECELLSGFTDTIPDSEVKEDVLEDTVKDVETGFKDGQPIDMKENVDGHQQNLVEDSEEEGEILEDDESIESPDKGHNRKGLTEKSRTNHRQESDHKGSSRSHHHRDLRDASKGSKDRSSDNRRLTTDGKCRRRSGSRDRTHKELPKRHIEKDPKRKEKERTGRIRSDDKCSRRPKDQRRETSDRRREEDRRKEEEKIKAAFLQKKREKHQRLERKRTEEIREARRLEDERRLQEERKRTRRRENEKVRSRLHENDKKREPLRKSKKVSEGRRP